MSSKEIDKLHIKLAHILEQLGRLVKDVEEQGNIINNITLWREGLEKRAEGFSEAQKEFEVKKHENRSRTHQAWIKWIGILGLVITIGTFALKIIEFIYS